MEIDQIKGKSRGKSKDKDGKGKTKDWKGPKSQVRPVTDAGQSSSSPSTTTSVGPSASEAKPTVRRIETNSTPVILDHTEDDCGEF